MAHLVTRGKALSAQQCHLLRAVKHAFFHKGGPPVFSFGASEGSDLDESNLVPGKWHATWQSYANLPLHWPADTDPAILQDPESLRTTMHELCLLMGTDRYPAIFASPDLCCGFQPDVHTTAMLINLREDHDFELVLALDDQSTMHTCISPGRVYLIRAVDRVKSPDCAFDRELLADADTLWLFYPTMEALPARAARAHQPRDWGLPTPLPVFSIHGPELTVGVALALQLNSDEHKEVRQVHLSLLHPCDTGESKQLNDWFNYHALAVPDMDLSELMPELHDTHWFVSADDIADPVWIGFRESARVEDSRGQFDFFVMTRRVGFDLNVFVRDEIFRGWCTVKTACAFLQSRAELQARADREATQDAAQAETAFA